MRWKHQPQELLFWLHQTGAHEKVSLQRAGGQRDHVWLTAVAQENVETHICQQCRSNTAVVRCRDCRPCPFFCAECDASMHTRHPLHNRDASTAGFFQPLPPTTFVLNNTLCPCGKFLKMSLILLSSVRHPLSLF